MPTLNIEIYLIDHYFNVVHFQKKTKKQQQQTKQKQNNNNIREYISIYLDK